MHIFISFLDGRWSGAMVEMGLLYFSHELWTECCIHKWVSCHKMEQCKLIIWLPIILACTSFSLLLWFLINLHAHSSLLQPNTDPKYPEPTIGKVLLQSRGFYTEDYWFWICVCALLGFSVLYNLFFIAALTFLSCKSYFINSTFFELEIEANFLADQIYSFERFKEFYIGWWWWQQKGFI